MSHKILTLIFSTKYSEDAGMAQKTQKQERDPASEALAVHEFNVRTSFCTFYGAIIS